MPKFSIGAREFEAPVFVPSVSSYETQIKPADALILQSALDEPISLASAFDLEIHPDELPRAAAQFRERSAVLLLDSGGYEASRYTQFKPQEKAKLWPLEKYLANAGKIQFDRAFSYDLFPEERQSIEQYVDLIADLVSQHQPVIPAEAIIPVLHLQTDPGVVVFDVNASEALMRRSREVLRSEFIAIPERELGTGIVERACHAKRLVATLGDCKLHVLGCGNPLSIALLGLAGVTMMDGLEWCRTIVAPDDSHLHHYQHLRIFETDLHQHDLVAGYIAERSDDYVVKAALHNLALVRSFLKRYRDALAADSVEAFLKELYGEGAARAAGIVKHA